MRKRRAFFPSHPTLPEHQLQAQREARDALKSTLIGEHPELRRAKSVLKYLIECAYRSREEAAGLAVEWVAVMDHLQRAGCTDQRGEWRNVPAEARLRRCPFESAHQTKRAHTARIEGPMVRNGMRCEFRCTDPACARRTFADVRALVKPEGAQ